MRQLAPDVRAHAEAVCLVAELDLLKPHKAVTGFDLWVQLYLKVCLLIAIVCMQLYVYGKGRHADMLLYGNKLAFLHNHATESHEICHEYSTT